MALSDKKNPLKKKKQTKNPIPALLARIFIDYNLRR